MFKSFMEDIWAIYCTYVSSQILIYCVLMTFFSSLFSAKMEFLQKKNIHFLMLKAFKKDV